MVVARTPTCNRGCPDMSSRAQHQGQRKCINGCRGANSYRSGDIEDSDAPYWPPALRRAGYRVSSMPLLGWTSRVGLRSRDPSNDLHATRQPSMPRHRRRRLTSHDPARPGDWDQGGHTSVLATVALGASFTPGWLLGLLHGHGRRAEFAYGKGPRPCQALSKPWNIRLYHIGYHLELPGCVVTPKEATVRRNRRCTYGSRPSPSACYTVCPSLRQFRPRQGTLQQAGHSSSYPPRPLSRPNGALLAGREHRTVGSANGPDYPRRKEPGVPFLFPQIVPVHPIISHRLVKRPHSTPHTPCQRPRNLAGGEPALNCPPPRRSGRGR